MSWNAEPLWQSWAEASGKHSAACSTNLMETACSTEGSRINNPWISVRGAAGWQQKGCCGSGGSRGCVVNRGNFFRLDRYPR
jgi:hypothetical protein